MAIVLSVKPTRRALVNGILVGVIVLALAGGGLWLWHPWSASAAGASATRLTATVQRGSVSQTVTASGSIAPTREVAASFQVSGTVSAVDVSVGQVVTAGQTLATIDASDLETAQSEGWTQYVHAEQNLTAAEQQATSGSGQGGGNATASINAAKGAVTKASDAYQQAKAQVALATLTAPIGGLVIAVNGEVGGSSGGSSASSGSGTSGGSGASGGGSGSNSSSSSGSGFVTIADTSAYVVTANIAEADIADVAVGQAASITFPALTGITATAKVTAISPTATASNSVVTYATTITLDKLPAKVRLGQTAEVAITIASSKDDALFVPAAAITTANGTSTVEVVDQKTGTTSTVDVITGVVGDQGTEITHGLTAGQTVVIGTLTPSTTGTGGTTGITGRTGTRGGFGGGTGGFGGNGGAFGGTGGSFRGGANG
ncbi:HlyD family efflux transporter periplasmic adaptor subunit [Pseudolysinimonas kribbensis]|uniref:RND transporter n=1 Tax=Pseudolysinimonas kribbensis TaxID=433641 RepID=A0ABQ6K487_9MICO|nr:HlyD family efflux transporter periplasmic adaptor subunit [Pseudolysinimonas kribbensis]GMA95430.1 RND transporter [Pseudolysinimonas kribbensis]